MGRNNKGFTLVEVIVSIMIFGISTAGTVQAIHYTNIMSIEAREMSAALNDARAVLDRIKVTELSAFPENATVAASSIWSTLSTFISDTNASQRITVTCGSGNALREITVTVSWTGPRNKQQQLQFVVLKSLMNG